MQLIKTTTVGLLKFNDIDGVTSNIVAERLGVEHSDLRKIIKKVKKMWESHSGFFPSENSLNPLFLTYQYANKRGRIYECDLMNEDAFSLVLKQTNSQKAFDIFVEWFEEFKELKLERHYRTDSRVLSKPVTDELKKLYYALHEFGSSQVEEFLYMTFHKKSYKAITRKKFNKDKLDELSYTQARDLAELRNNAAKKLKIMLKDEYESPKVIRSNLWKYIESFSS